MPSWGNFIVSLACLEAVMWVHRRAGMYASGQIKSLPGLCFKLSGFCLSSRGYRISACMYVWEPHKCSRGQKKVSEPVKPELYRGCEQYVHWELHPDLLQGQQVLLIKAITLTLPSLKVQMSYHCFAAGCCCILPLSTQLQEHNTTLHSYEYIIFSTVYFVYSFLICCT